jgi:hypothetical protein
MAAVLVALLAGGAVLMLLALRQLGAVLDQPTLPAYQAPPSTCPATCGCRGQRSE